MSSATESDPPGYHFLFEVTASAADISVLVRTSVPGRVLELTGVLTMRFEVYVMLRAMLAVGATPLEDDVEVRWIEDDVVRDLWTDTATAAPESDPTALYPDE